MLQSTVRINARPRLPLSIGYYRLLHGVHKGLGGQEPSSRIALHIYLMTKGVIHAIRTQNAVTGKRLYLLRCSQVRTVFQRSNISDHQRVAFCLAKKQS
jgi:hypothetical protein